MEEIKKKLMLNNWTSKQPVSTVPQSVKNESSGAVKLYRDDTHQRKQSVDNNDNNSRVTTSEQKY